MAHKYRLYPEAQQEQMLKEHAGQTRLLYNLCLEQAGVWSRSWRGEKSPTHNKRTKQLVELRKDIDWLSSGSSAVQQSALRDFDTGMQRFYKRQADYPKFKKRGDKDSFTIRDVQVQIHNKKNASVFVPKLGFVKFKLHRKLPAKHGMARVTSDSTGAWYISFTAPQPAFIKEATNKRGAGDLGIKTTLRLNDGRSFRCPQMSKKDKARLLKLEQQAARQQTAAIKRGNAAKQAVRVAARAAGVEATAQELQGAYYAGKRSRRLEQTRTQIARIHRKDANRRKNWVEKTSTTLVRDYCVFAFEKLNIKGMMKSPAAKPDPENEGQYLANGATAKSALSCLIAAQGWGMLVDRCGHKADAATEHTFFHQVNPAYTSQTCPECNHIAKENRESQAVFRCVECHHTENADVIGAKNVHTRSEQILVENPELLLQSSA